MAWKKSAKLNMEMLQSGKVRQGGKEISSHCSPASEDQALLPPAQKRETENIRRFQHIEITIGRSLECFDYTI
jgi:hypothetical protein